MPVLDHGPRDVPFVALTFDDGPSAHTPAILDALAAAHAQATFFVSGRSLRGNEAIVRRAVEEGHEVGNHALTHAPLRGHPLRALRETAAVQRRLAAVTGSRPRAFRAPYGAGAGVVHALGLYLAGWDVDPRDWTRPGAEEIAARVLDGVRCGSIVLLHDGRGDRSQTAGAVALILAGLERKNLQPVTLNRLFRRAITAAT